MISIFKYVLVVILCSTMFADLFAQYTSGKIVYERRTNLFKKFKEYKDEDWLKEEDKNKIDVFELYFNDSLSCFKPQESELKEKMSWATSKNTVYRNQVNEQVLNIKSIWGEKLYLKDTFLNRNWKITENMREIGGYNCRKAIWQADDSTRIYAWYCDEIIPSIGPETFGGLPGAILGLASEDGGIIYFAKTVELNRPEMAMLIPEKLKQKIYTTPELKTKLEKQFGDFKWGKRMIENTFGYW